MSDDVSVGTDSRVNHLQTHLRTHTRSSQHPAIHNPQPTAHLGPLFIASGKTCSTRIAVKIGGQNREERLRPNMAEFVL